MTIRVNGADTEWHDDDLAAACAAGPDAIVVPKVDSADEVRALVDGDGDGTAPPSTPSSGRWSRRRDAMLHAEEIAAASDRLDRAGDGHQRPGQGAVRRARARPRSRC